MLNAIDEKYIREYVKNANPNDTGSEAHMLCDLLSEIDLLRKENERVIRWIPVSERLPEKEGLYLVRHSTGVIDASSKSIFQWSTHTVTHWAVLPAGPEEGKDA